jgi:G6PDH family F420-dependent oxidoreductase
MTDFGYFLSSEELGPAAIVEAGQAAERAGLDRVWVSDHYHPWLHAQGESPFVWSVLGALAATTSLQLTTAVTCPTVRIHPAIIAQATATTAALAPGRFRFGIGTGERLNEHVLGDVWPPVEVRLEMLEEAVEIIRALWTGETLTHDGAYYTVHTATLFSRPESPPPILMSAFGPHATDVAARIAEGFISVTPDTELLERYRAGGGTGVSQAGTKICWAPTEEEAAQTACRLWGHSVVGGAPSQELAVPEHFEPLAEIATPAAMAESVPCGPDPDRAAAHIREFAEAGFDEVYVAQMGPRQEEAIRFLTEEVLPRV